MKDAEYQPATFTGSSRAGVSEARRVKCSVHPVSHGVHPEDEACPYCPGYGESRPAAPR
jgi:hypothetical protein